MSKHGFGKNQPLISTPAEIPKKKGPVDDLTLIQILHNLRFQDDAIVERTVKFLREPELTSRLLGWLDDKNHPYLGHVVTAMRFLHEPRAVAKLLPLASIDEPVLQEAVLLALIVLKDPSALQVFIDALKSKNETLRYMAATGLGALGDAQALAPLDAAIASEPKLYVAEHMKTARAQLSRAP